ncbi:VanZ family protein [Halobacillus aidingensis]|uniref:VanZ like family protein n=1 Tax=Halobacillus aidingensis TaxID=240303 RepID=A0A1H0H842_HALAD|nr:VanZ family protein [Halobacillus aidingensis]SDO15302.1 VanZ like family protein [Halobacillus aidingensis]
MTLGFFLESLHLVEFAFLYILVVLALQVHNRFSKTTNLLAAIFASFYGLIDEIHQLFVDGRSFTINDLIKDWCGVWITYFVVYLKYLRWAKHSHGTTDDSVEGEYALFKQKP